MENEFEKKEGTSQIMENEDVSEGAAAEAEIEADAAEVSDATGDGAAEAAVKKENSKGSELLAWIRDIAAAIIIALIISRFITPTIVQEHSMDDTLQHNDYLIMWKMAYVFDEPDYGDIVIFKSELLDENGKHKNLIKRVVAKGGDTISLSDGFVTRNGELLTEPYTKDGYTSGDIAETVVPEGTLFLLGDNRAVSVDSRDPAVGFVDEDLLVGKAVFRLYPFSQIGGLYDNYTGTDE